MSRATPIFLHSVSPFRACGGHVSGRIRPGRGKTGSRPKLANHAQPEGCRYPPGGAIGEHAHRQELHRGSARQGRVTVISAKPIPVPSAVFGLPVGTRSARPRRRALRQQHLEDHPRGRRAAGTGLTGTNSRRGSGDALITEVIQLENVQVAQLVAALRPLMSSTRTTRRLRTLECSDHLGPCGKCRAHHSA